MLIAIVLSLVGLGLVCWLLFILAVHALPAMAGVLAGAFAYRTGAGPVGAAFVGLIAGTVALVLGEMLFAATRSPTLRLLVAAVYVAPAAVAGYHAVHGLSAVGTPSELWRELFAVSGAVVIAGVAWARVSAVRPSHAGRDVATTSAGLR